MKQQINFRAGKRTAANLDYISRQWGMSQTETITALIEKEIATMSAATNWRIREEWGVGVAYIASLAGAMGIRELGDGYTNPEKNPDSHCTFFELLGDNANFPIRGATTNADPLWEDDDGQAFAELAEACGVEI